ncbi:MAG TPA: nucleotidyltransferase domain-containing protein [Methanospirillum sp.]|nr:nucleotidyltransferase domain-containing protein [Methanospirillum sp.]
MALWSIPDICVWQLCKRPAKPESDLDLIISFNRVVGLFTLGGIREELAEKLGIQVDLLTERALNPLLKDHILHEAVEIFPHEE